MVGERHDQGISDAPLPLPSTFDQLYRREWPNLLRVAVVLCENHAVAEELVQEVFIKAHRNWSKVQHYESPEGWLRRVLVNTATSQFRRLQAEARALVRIRRAVPVPEASAETTELWRLIRKLPTRQAQVIALYYGDDLPTGDIAEILEVAEGTVRACLHQARARLAELIQEGSHGDP